MNQSLHDGVVRDVQTVGEDGRTRAVAVVDVELQRRHDPVLPADLRHDNLQLLSSAEIVGRSNTVQFARGLGGSGGGGAVSASSTMLMAPIRTRIRVATDPSMGVPLAVGIVL